MTVIIIYPKDPKAPGMDRMTRHGCTNFNEVLKFTQNVYFRTWVVSFSMKTINKLKFWLIKLRIDGNVLLHTMKSIVWLFAIFA